MNSNVPLSADLIAHSSGALWIPSSRSLLVADLHLGYGWAQRRRGELGPLADSRARDKLFAVVNELVPREIVFLGDLVHAPRPCPPERQWIEETLSSLAAQTRLISVRGNHDRAFAHEFGHLEIQTVNLWETAAITAVHGDRFDIAIPEHTILVVGHLHPCLTVSDAAGASRKLPVFLHCPNRIVLPAFSPFAAGFEVSHGLPAEMAALFCGHTIEAVAVSGTRALRLGPLEQVLTRFSESSTSTPGQYQRQRYRRSSS